MYIVKKIINNNAYYYLNKSIRKGKKVISKNIAYLGKDKELAEKKAQEIKNKMKQNKISENSEELTKNISNNFEKQDKENKGGEINLEELTSFCKKKGFIFKSSDLYGGLSGFWDFGPLGIELFNNLKEDWWNFFIKNREDIVGIETSIISHPKTWEASGHITNFNDIFAKCKSCGKTKKIDEKESKKIKCECGGECEIQGKFNLMFKTEIGVINPSIAYLRGETAQGMFTDFKIIQQTSRKQLPFGIAQIGKCFRNEIAPRNFLFRSREFHIAELEFFINIKENKCDLLKGIHKKIKIKLLDKESQKQNKNTKENNNNNNNFQLKIISIEELLKQKKLGEWQAYWLAEQILWLRKIGLNEIKIREHTSQELSHYSTATFDIDYDFVFGSKEIAGNANRGQYDLTQHQKFSKQSMEIYDEKFKNKEIPRVIEPTFGMERIFLAILTKAYNYDKERGHIILKIPPKLAPIKAAIFPIVKQEKYIKLARKIVEDLKKDFNVTYDKSGSVGRRYARNDEIGTPYCITIDKKSLEENTVTIRWRDTTEQIRVKINILNQILKESIKEEKSILDFGEKEDTRKK